MIRLFALRNISYTIVPLHGRTCEQDAVQQELSYFPALLRCLAAFASPPRPSSTRDELLLATG